MNPKYSRCQDYVIKNGALVGEFEEMYRDHEDPWEQSTREAFATEKAMVLNVMEAMQPKTVLELGCGLGHFTARIKARGIPRVVGVDISKTAIEKARRLHPDCEFMEGDILDFQTYERYRPDIIVMGEISWYVLEKLNRFKQFLREKMPSTYVVHLLTTYSPGKQEYGKNHFTNLEEILKFFEMNYVEYGEVRKPFLHDDCRRTYFLGRYEKLELLKL